MQDAAASALAPLSAGYAQLFAHVLSVAESDDRIRSLWLGGSVGRAVADAGSDLDVVLAIRPAAFDDFAAGWQDWLAQVTPVVFAQELPRMPGSFYSVTPDCLRLDVVLELAGAPRRDWLLGVVGVQNVHMMLYQLFVEANQPLPPMGIKQWSAKLTARQRQVCAALPAPTASPAGVLTAMRAAAAAFRQEAMAVLAANDGCWPADFDDAVRRYWERELGWAE